jgi:hypothetical protein
MKWQILKQSKNETQNGVSVLTHKAFLADRAFALSVPHQLLAYEHLPARQQQRQAARDQRPHVGLVEGVVDDDSECQEVEEGEGQREADQTSQEDQVADDPVGD